MLVFDEGDSYRFITQQDHAGLAAELVSLWREQRAGGAPAAADLLFAVQQRGR